MEMGSQLILCLSVFLFAGVNLSHGSEVSNVEETNTTLLTYPFELKGKAQGAYISCNADKDCSMVPNAVCSDVNKCVCRKGYRVTPDRTQCMLVMNSPCLWNEDCLNLPHSECDSYTHLCKCETGFQPNNEMDACWPLVGGPCQDGKCPGLDNAECKGTPPNDNCRCKAGFRSSANLSTCVIVMGSPCFWNEDCLQLLHSECDSLTHLCKCEKGFKPNNEMDACGQGTIFLTISAAIFASMTYFIV